MFVESRLHLFRFKGLHQPPDHVVIGSGDTGLDTIFDDFTVNVIDLGAALCLDILKHGRLVITGIFNVVDGVGVVV
jgi:hypothetical protein